MESLATYLIKSSVWLTGFALFYALFLRNERFFLLNRIYLVSGILAAFVFPHFTWHYTVLLPVVPTVEVSEPVVQGIAATKEPFPTQNMLLLILYLSGIIYLIFRILKQTLPIFRIIRKSEKQFYSSAKLIRTAEYPASFSFFSFVFVNPSIDETETNEIVNHELEHIRQQHWIDLLLFEILRAVQWFNPACWLYGHFIRQNHEYLADERALQRSSNPAVYRAALLNQLFGGPVITLANSFNYSINKKRFKMMKQTISSPIRKLKLLLVVPLIAGVFYAFSAPEYKFENVTEKQEQEKPLYIISKEKIDISFTPQLRKGDLEIIKSELAKVGFQIEYTSLDFSENGNLKQLSASVKRPSGSVTFNSGDLTPTNYPRFKLANDGSFGVYFQKAVTGRVMDENGNPLKNASVIISGKTIGTITDNDGKFLLTVTDDSPIVVSYVGFQSAKMNPDFEKEMSFILKTEVVKIGFPDKAVKTSTPLEISDKVLIIIDGKKSTKTELDKIDPNKIQSINVLKDKNATEKYGENSKDGVIEITLKNEKTTTGKNQEEVVAIGYGKIQNASSLVQPNTGFRIRSAGSENQPLIVIDGVVSPDKKMDDIDPGTIHSVNVLKGESTIPKYGEKGKNGVIEIVTKKASDVFFIVEEMPEFPGGQEALRAFIIATMQYPIIAKENGIQGKVLVNFVVAKDGSVTEAKVFRGVEPSLDKEALRIINNLPKWKPGKQRGEAVRVSYTVPVSFQLQDGNANNENPSGSGNPSKPTFTMVEEIPQFPGGVEALKAYVAASMKYPVIALENGIQGQVFVKFVVDKTGNVTNARISRGVDPSLDKEAKRIVESMPRWSPGKQNGEAVDVAYEMPVNFKMPADYRPISREKLRTKSTEFTKENETNHEMRSDYIKNALKYASSEYNKNPLIIVPNPTHDKATITLKGSESKKKLDVTIYDRDGKIIKKESKNGPTFTLSFASYISGTYLIVANDGTNQFSGQLVVNH